MIDRIFPASLRTFLKVVCQNGQIDSILDIFQSIKHWNGSSAIVRTPCWNM